MGARGIEWEVKQGEFAALREFATVTRRYNKHPLVVAAVTGNREQSFGTTLPRCNDMKFFILLSFNFFSSCFLGVINRGPFVTILSRPSLELVRVLH